MRLTHLLAAGLLAGCAATGEPLPEASLEIAPATNAAFDAGMIAAALPPAGFQPTLRAITGKTATMVSLNDPKFYPIGPVAVSPQHPLWVTAAGDVQARCQAFTDPEAGLAQLLGLQPGGADGRSLITLTVDSTDMFRPCADPRITTTSCPASVPAMPQGVDPDTWNADLQFVLNQIVTTYTSTATDAYPFTRMGYTYNWAPGGDPVGPSEFVIRGGAKITVTAVQSIAEYCAPPTG